MISALDNTLLGKLKGTGKSWYVCFEMKMVYLRYMTTWLWLKSLYHTGKSQYI